MQNGTDRDLQRPENCQTPGRMSFGTEQMWITIGVFITVIAVVIVRKMRVPPDVNGPNLGWMSEQWLAEHRASHLL